METTMIMIPLNKETARIYNDASAEEQSRIRFLMGLFLQDLILSPRSLKVVMDEIGQKARERGMTPEILNELLQDE